MGGKGDKVAKFAGNASEVGEEGKKDNKHFLSRVHLPTVSHTASVGPASFERPEEAPARAHAILHMQCKSSWGFAEHAIVYVCGPHGLQLPCGISVGNSLTSSGTQTIFEQPALDGTVFLDQRIRKDAECNSR